MTEEAPRASERFYEEAEAECKFPEVEVELVGKDGNAFLIIGRVREALKRAGHREEAKEFFEEAVKGDYDHVLRTVMKYVTVS